MRQPSDSALGRGAPQKRLDNMARFRASFSSFPLFLEFFGIISLFDVLGDKVLLALGGCWAATGSDAAAAAGLTAGV